MTLTLTVRFLLPMMMMRKRGERTHGEERESRWGGKKKRLVKSSERDGLFEYLRGVSSLLLSHLIYLRVGKRWEMMMNWTELCSPLLSWQLSESEVHFSTDRLVSLPRGTFISYPLLSRFCRCIFLTMHVIPFQSNVHIKCDYAFFTPFDHTSVCVSEWSEKNTQSVSRRKEKKRNDQFSIAPSYRH